VFPVIHPLQTTKQLLSGSKNDTTTLLLYENASNQLSSDLTTLKGQSSIAVIIGPEGGISPDEREQFIAHGAKEYLLTRNILR
jgi:16S rRNA (uracil1498-N3)-methyltransferase